MGLIGVRCSDNVPGAMASAHRACEFEFEGGARAVRDRKGGGDILGGFWRLEGYGRAYAIGLLGVGLLR